MSVQSDKWIIQMARDNDMISPFEDKQVRGDKISFGVSSYGYDATLQKQSPLQLPPTCHIPLA